MKNTYTLKSIFFFKIKIVTTLLLLLAISSLKAQSPTVFTTSGTWVCPQGVTSIQVEAWGGGGGGGGAANVSGYRGAGGGGGAYQKNISLAVTPGQSYTVTIGSGGIAGTNPCIDTTKGRGVTGIVTPEFDPFDIDYVAHEMGHVPRRGEKLKVEAWQFSVLHTRSGAVKWFKVEPAEGAPKA